MGNSHSWCIKPSWLINYTLLTHVCCSLITECSLFCQRQKETRLNGATFIFLMSRCCSVHAFANFLTLPCVCVCMCVCVCVCMRVCVCVRGHVPAEHHRSCYMDQPIRGHLDNHSPVACGDHIHAPEDYPSDTQDRPQVRHVPGTAQRDALNSVFKQCSHASWWTVTSTALLHAAGCKQTHISNNVSGYWAVVSFFYRIFQHSVWSR